MVVEDPGAFSSDDGDVEAVEVANCVELVVFFTRDNVQREIENVLVKPEIDGFLTSRVILSILL